LSTDFKFSRELVELRRAKVLELVAQAVPQNQIAIKLGVSPATISLDMQYLRETSQTKIKDHTETRIPMQFEECHAGLKLILRKTYEIMDDKSKRTEEQLSAMNLAVNIYGRLMDLSTNGAILEKTTKWINELKQQLQLQSQSQQSAKSSGPKEKPEGKQDFQDDEEPPPVEPEEDLGEE
jgi:predicted transcriptional regulator